LGSPRTVEIAPLTMPLAILETLQLGLAARARAYESGHARAPRPPTSPETRIIPHPASVSNPPFSFIYGSSSCCCTLACNEGCGLLKSVKFIKFHLSSVHAHCANGHMYC
jgi:hypothetical protein